MEPGNASRASAMKGDSVKNYMLEPPAAKEYIPICPVCGKECDTVYLDSDRDVAGCDRCISPEDAYEYLYEEEET